MTANTCEKRGFFFSLQYKLQRQNFPQFLQGNHFRHDEANIYFLLQPAHLCGQLREGAMKVTYTTGNTWLDQAPRSGRYDGEDGVWGTVGWRPWRDCQIIRKSIYVFELFRPASVTKNNWRVILSYRNRWQKSWSEHQTTINWHEEIRAEIMLFCPSKHQIYRLSGTFLASGKMSCSKLYQHPDGDTHDRWLGVHA